VRGFAILLLIGNVLLASLLSMQAARGSSQAAGWARKST
jgi:hypothetical protein